MENKMIKVTNRSRGSVGYMIPDMNNLQRRFEYGETKMIPEEEIRKLDWTPGGHVLIKDYLKIEDAKLIEELLHEVEPEYNYTEKEIKELLLGNDMDAFMDCLDFGPDGVIDLMKDLAVKLEIPDVRKRDAISKRTNSNIDNMIKLNQMSKEEDKEPVETKQRRTAGLAQVEGSTNKDGRTTTTTIGPQKYNVVSK